MMANVNIIIEEQILFKKENKKVEKLASKDFKNREVLSHWGLFIYMNMSLNL